MQFNILDIQYHPHTGAIAVLVEDELELGRFYINLNERTFPNPDNWDNETVRVHAETKLDNPASAGELPTPLVGKGHTIAFLPTQEDETEPQIPEMATETRVPAPRPGRRAARRPTKP